MHLKSNEKVWKNKTFCENVMSSEKDNILGFKRYMNSDKMPVFIYSFLLIFTQYTLLMLILNL